MKFLELTHPNDNTKVLVNMALVTDIEAAPEGTYLFFNYHDASMGEPAFRRVKEPLSEIILLIKGLK
jgi:hypothetical protein